MQKVEEKFDPKERLNRLRLIRSENVGPITYRQLMARFGSAEEALSALPSLAKRGGRKRGIKIQPAAEAERELDALEALGGSLLIMGEAAFPRALAAIEDCPPVLQVIGHPHILETTAVAMVGTRNASTNGKRMADRFARAIGAEGYVVVSGLARGIDAAAHTGALDSGTAAVLAGGVDDIYPKDNADLYRQIAERGLLISEMPLGTVPQARHFPRRNRIISGLSVATLVVEAQLKSGSLITARLAADQGREVMALPGSPLDARARGTNDLIRKGAQLIETPEEAIAFLRGLPEQRMEEPASDFDAPFGAPREGPELNRLRHRLREAVSPSPTSIDDLIRDMNAAPGAVTAVILEMELAGEVERLPGNLVVRVYGASSDGNTGG